MIFMSMEKSSEAVMENNIVLKQIYERKSHRAFLDAEITKEDKEKILYTNAKNLLGL